MSEANLDMDFNLDDEYVADPLIPQGTYKANVTNVSYDAEKMCIIWQYALDDNGGVMNDGETPVDGAVVFGRNWLPKPGDELIPTPSGKTNKRQAKINMLKDFAAAMGVDMNTPAQIMEGINESQWLGIEVLVTLEVREWEGKFSNDIKKVQRAPEA